MTTDAVVTFIERFVHRYDTFAIQHDDGSYRRVPRFLRHRDIERHFDGHLTLGLYPATACGTVRWGCLDDDQDDGDHHLRVIAEDAHRLGLRVVPERSRRGGHLWVLIKEATPAPIVRQALKVLLQRADHQTEIFPKQDLPPRYGNPVRMPLGVHRLTGQRYPILNPNTWLPLEGTPDEILRDLPWVTTRELESVAARYRAPCAALRSIPKPPNQGPSVIGQIKARLDLAEVAKQYTGLNYIAGRLRGLCPLHTEAKASFYVFPDGRWWCFGDSCGQGGDVLDLICAVEGWTLSQAIRRLR